MYKSTIQRRFVTLIEMMIVMFLIALITGVIAYNYRGSLDEGKAFKTKAGIERLETILNLEIAKHPQAANQVTNNWQDFVRASPIVHDPNALIKDGWGQDYNVSVNPETGGVHVTSAKYEEYQKSHNTSFRE